MSTITKQWLQQKIADMEEHRDLFPGDLDDDHASVLSAFRIALASLESEKCAEPVAFINGAWTLVYYRPPKELGLKIGDKLYAAPPAPVSVPDAVDYSDLDATSKDREVIEAIAECKGWNACRAAMLQGAEHVTTDYKLPFEQWISQQTGTIDVDCGWVNTEVFYHWLRVAYEAGNSPVIPDGWALVPVEPTLEMIKAGANAASAGMLIPGMYRAILAVAPQQEVK